MPFSLTLAIFGVQCTQTESEQVGHSLLHAFQFEFMVAIASHNKLSYIDNLFTEIIMNNDDMADGSTSIFRFKMK